MSSATATTACGRYHQPILGAIFALASMSLFSMQDAIVKWLASSNHWLIQMLFFRSIVIVIIMATILSLQKGRNAFHTKKPRDHLVRTCYNFLAFFSYYIAIMRMPLSEVTAIALSAPLIMAALSGPLLGERPDMSRKMALATGFAGVLIVLQPNAAHVDYLGICCAILGAFLFALLGLQTRKMSATESSELMVFTAASAFMVATGAMLLLCWQPLHTESLLLMACLGISTLIAQYTLVSAYQVAAVYIVAPFEYVTIFWALTLGWLFFGEMPTLLMLSGVGLIISSAATLIYLEHRDLRRIRLIAI